MPGADFLQLDPADAPPHGLAELAHRRAARRGRRRAAARRKPGCPPPASWPLSSECRAGWSSRPTSGSPTRGCSAGGAAAAPPSWPPHRRPAPPPSSRRHRTSRSTCAPALPDLSAFPRQAWLRAERTALAAYPGRRPGLRRPARHPRAAHGARAVARPHPRRARRPVDDRRRQRRGAGSRAARPGAHGRGASGRSRFEDPGSRPGPATSCSGGGSSPFRCRWTAHGLDVAALAAAGLETVVVTPAHQFPTGVVLAADASARPARLGAGGRAGDRGRLRRRAPLRPAAGRRPAGARARARSRIWAACPRPSRPRCGSAGWSRRRRCATSWSVRKQWSDITSPALGQLALAELITSGGFEQHLRLVRARQRVRRDALLAALRRAPAGGPGARRRRRAAPASHACPRASTTGWSPRPPSRPGWPCTRCRGTGSAPARPA